MVISEEWNLSYNDTQVFSLNTTNISQTWCS